MSDFVILLLILLLVVCLVLTLVAFVFYTGLLSDVVVRTGSPPVKTITIAYKFAKGSYKACGAAFTESCSIGPNLSAVGVYYDDPNETPADQCRYVVGSILCENEEEPDKEMQCLYEKFGYKVISFPEVSCAVTSSFPNRCSLSPVCGAYRVYPELQHYIKERKLSAQPFMEIYKGGLIHYMCPLENQTSFYVPELLKASTEPEEPEQTVENREADRKESLAGLQSEIQAAVGKTEEVLETPVLPLVGSQQGLSEEDAPSEDEERGGKESSESVGSGSSFEELAMEVEEDKVEENNEADIPAVDEGHHGQQKNEGV